MTRIRLPNRRGSLTFEFELNGLKFTATASRFGDGSLGELFLVNHKAGSGKASGPVGAALDLIEEGGRHGK
jgi:hypothetical protein